MDDASARRPQACHRTEKRAPGRGVVFRPIRAPDACVEVSLAWLAERGDAAAGLFGAFVRDHAPMTTPSTFA
jgi:hypothetical protein